MDLSLFKLAFAFHSAATALSLGYLFSRDERLTRWTWRLLGVGLALHLASFGLRAAGFWAAPEHRWFLPVHSFFGALSWLSLATAAVFWWVEGRHRVRILGAFVLPWSWAAAAAALAWAEQGVPPMRPELRSVWMNLHPVVLMAAYGAFANAFGVGLAHLVQERQVKSRRPGELCFRLPSLEELDRLHYRIVAGALPVLSAGIGMGAAWAFGSWETPWGLDPKVLAALATWVLYASYLTLRAGAVLRGRRSVYLSMAGFAGVVLTFFVVERLSGLHAFLDGAG